MLLLGRLTFAQTVLSTPDPKEPVGERPYEMVWANRTEPSPPTIRFDDLTGWTIVVERGARASLQVSRAQNVWGRPVAKLRYSGEGGSESKPRVLLLPPEPIRLPDDADSVEMWVFGNRWERENRRDTPPVHIVLHFRDGSGKASDTDLGNIRWKEWWLMHKKLASGLKPPIRLESIEAANGSQSGWREIFFDSIRVYREKVPALQFAARPKRNLQLFEGQSPGANNGTGKLSFPTREQTILPIHLGGAFRNSLVEEPKGTYRFNYVAQDCTVTFVFVPRDGLSSLLGLLNNQAVGVLMDGAAVHRSSGSTNALLRSTDVQNRQLTAVYDDGTTLHLLIWQKSLVVDVANRTGEADRLKFGQLSRLVQPRLITIPFLDHNTGPQPCVLLSLAGTNPVFSSIWLDWYRSNGSEPYAAESVSTNTASINGGIGYKPRTDGQRNPMFERVFITLSPVFEEVLPTVPNPVGLHAHDAVDRLWQESWGPQDYAKQMKRSAVLRAYGIEKLIHCNHENTWRDAGESFTLRTRAAPKKGGDPALKSYIAHQRNLGWLAGLYSNYADYAPVNEFWNPDDVQRLPDGNWRSAYPGCWGLKPLKAVEYDALLAPQIKAKFDPNSAYTDVQTAVPPWVGNDYDARVPGAGTFAQTFYACGELLQNDSRAYGGPIFSEGTYQWMYAGLADGNYAQACWSRPMAKEPLLPVFDLYQIHTKECDIGMGWTRLFCDAIPNWRQPENLDSAIDRFLLNTLAYGHIGWLVEDEQHGIERTCRSYYMLQQVQARYGLQKPVRIGYWDGAQLVNVSTALIQDLPRSRRQLYVEYPSGLRLWLNDHPNDNWVVTPAAGDPQMTTSSSDSRNGIILPPSGWVVSTTNAELFSYSALNGTNRADYLRSPAYTYLDGRGHRFETPEAVADGGLVIRPLGPNQLVLVHVSGHDEFTVRRPYQVSGALSTCEAFDVEGQEIASPECHDNGDETRIKPLEKALRYVLRFGEKR